MGSYNDALHLVAKEAAERANIDVGIFFSLIGYESNWNPLAISDDGAIGIAQIMPIFHPSVNPRNATDSLFYAARLLRNYLDQHHQSYEFALAAYNVGGPTVAGWLAVPQWELDRYVHPILNQAKAIHNDPEFILMLNPLVVETIEPEVPRVLIATSTPTAIAMVSFPSDVYVQQSSVPVPILISPTPTPTPFATVFLCAMIFALWFRE